MSANPLTRDGQFAKVASDYCDACNNEDWLRKKIEDCKREADDLRQKSSKLHDQLAEFVGQNIRTKTAIYGNQILRVEFIDHGKATVIIEEAVRAG